VAVVEEAVDEVTADEAGATGNDAFHRNIRDANAQRNRPANVECKVETESAAGQLRR
jgi:hypothetical protein